MNKIAINPRKLVSEPEIKNFQEGYTLDRHTLSSTRTDDPYFEYDTVRTALGELLYNIKYKITNNCDKSNDCLNLIVDTLEYFIKTKTKWIHNQKIDYIIPAPYSIKREIQPVELLAKKLSERLNLPYLETLSKAGYNTPIKNTDKDDRPQILKKAIQLKNAEKLIDKKILLLDDIFDSGATIRRCIEILIDRGHAKAVYALVLTRTRR